MTDRIRNISKRYSSRGKEGTPEGQLDRQGMVVRTLSLKKRQAKWCLPVSSSSNSPSLPMPYPLPFEKALLLYFQLSEILSRQGKMSFSPTKMIQVTPNYTISFPYYILIFNMWLWNINFSLVCMSQHPSWIMHFLCLGDFIFRFFWPGRCLTWQLRGKNWLHQVK